MKNLLLKLSLFLCGICVGQPSPPSFAYNDFKGIKRIESREEIKYSTLNFGMNVGSLKSLGGEVDIQYKRHILGVGYSGNINSYKDSPFKNEALFVTYAYDFQPLVVGVRVGKQNDADWVRVNLSQTSYTFEKQVTPYSLMVGVYVGYKVTNKARVNVGCDSFSQVTIGITFGL